MKFGIFDQVPCADWQSSQQRYQDVLDQIELADELGFDHAWLGESHFYPTFSIMASPLLLAAAAAQRTKRIRLGVAVSLLPLHNPIRMAEDVTTLDILSDGRAEFGVGRGGIPVHFQGFNTPLEDSRARFLEVLDFIVQAWTHDEFSFDGEYHTAKNVSLAPKPLQKPHPPIRMACNSDGTFDLAGRMGYPLFATPTVIPRPRLLENIQRYRGTLAEHGHTASGEEVYLQVPFYVAPDQAQAQWVPEPSVTNYLEVIKGNLNEAVLKQAEAENPGRADSIRRLLNMNYEGWHNDIAFYGDPAQCTEKIGALQQEFQMAEFICWFNVGGLIASADVMDSMRLFASEVMPHFR